MLNEPKIIIKLIYIPSPLRKSHLFDIYLSTNDSAGLWVCNQSLAWNAYTTWGRSLS